MLADDFPLYQLLVGWDKPGSQKAKNDFEAAAAGDLQKQYSFALGIQGISEHAALIPEVTPVIIQKTLQSCLKVFQRIADSPHALKEAATQMVAVCEQKLIIVNAKLQK